MTFLARLRSWWRATRHASRTESDMNAELRAHIAAHAESLIATGIPPAEARRRAELEFGPLTQTMEACRAARATNLLPSLMQDLAFGLRMLRKNPGFAALSVITLALGIGATTAVFSLVNGVLLRALPYRNPDRLVYLYQPIPTLPASRWKSGARPTPISTTGRAKAVPLRVSPFSPPTAATSRSMALPSASTARASPAISFTLSVSPRSSAAPSGPMTTAPATTTSP